MDRPIKEQLLDHLPPGEVSGAALPEHLTRALEADAGLAARWEGWQRQAQALAGLAPMDAPLDLDGRVVAATHSGHRQERAVRQVAGLGTVPAPSALSGVVRREVEQPFAGSRGDIAPEELDRRVAADLNAGGADERVIEAPGSDAERRTPGLIMALTVVSVLFVAAWLRVGAETSTPEPETRSARIDPPTLTFEVVELNPADLDADHPLMSLSGFGGGVWEGSQR